MQLNIIRKSRLHPTRFVSLTPTIAARLAGQEQWLDQARNLAASPAFQPYAKKGGCPDVMKPPKSFEAIMSMSDSILTCLKKVAGTS